MKKSIKAGLCILLALSVAAGAVCLGVTFIGKEYTQAPDTAYKILQITDVHILNDEKRTPKHLKLLQRWSIPLIPISSWLQEMSPAKKKI